MRRFHVFMTMLLLASPYSGSVCVVFGQEEARRGGTSNEPDAGFHPIHEGYAAYPRVVELTDGDLLATFDHRTAAGRAIGSTRSSDGGRTWGEYRPISKDAGGVDLANAFPLQLDDGTILVACRRNRPAASRYRLEVHASNDQGRRWALRSILAEGSKGLWEPLLLLMPDGTIQAYYASEEASHPDQTIEMRVSTDRGKTWSPPTTVAAKRGSRDGMPGVTRLPSGELLVVFEAQDMPPFRFILRAVRSNDGGRTWPNHRELVYRPSAPTSDRWSAGAPAIVLTRSGSLLAAFQTDERVSYQRNTRENDPRHPDYNYVQHTTLAVIRSDDGGKTWSQPSYLLGGPGDPACWNGLYSLRDGGLLVLTTHRGRVWCKRMDNSLRED